MCSSIHITTISTPDNIHTHWNSFVQSYLKWVIIMNLPENIMVLILTVIKYDVWIVSTVFIHFTVKEPLKK